MPDIKNLKKILRIIGIVLFVYILSRVNWPEFLEIFKKIDVFYFILAVLLIIPSILVRALKWQELVSSIGVKISRKTLVLLFSKGLFLGIITPGKLGEFYRAKYLVEATNISLEKAFYTVIFDKITDLLNMVFIGIPAVFILMRFFEVKALFMAVVLILLAILGIFFLTKRDYSQKFLASFLWLFLFDSLKRRAKNFFDDFFNEAKNLTKTLIIKLFCYELVAYFFTVLLYFLMALSLGIDIPFWYLCLIIPLVTITTAIPISIFGLGTREVSLIFLLSFINLNLNQAVAFSLLIMLWSILSGLPGLVLTYLPAKTLKS